MDSPTWSLICLPGHPSRVKLVHLLTKLFKNSRVRFLLVGFIEYSCSILFNVALWVRKVLRADECLITFLCFRKISLIAVCILEVGKVFTCSFSNAYKVPNPVKRWFSFSSVEMLVRIRKNSIKVRTIHSSLKLGTLVSVNLC